MISDQSEARRTLTEEENFQFVCSEDASCYIHEQKCNLGYEDMDRSQMCCLK